MRSRTPIALLLLLAVPACGAADRPELVPADIPFSALASPPAAPPPAAARRIAQPLAEAHTPPTSPPTAAPSAPPPGFIALLGFRLGRLPPKRPGVPRVAFVGDSLTFGWGVEPEEAYPEVLGRRLDAEGLPIEVINGGIPGVTSVGVRENIAQLTPVHPDIVVVAIGANDYLFNFPLDVLEDNLRGIVRAGRDMGARVLLVGLHLTRAFASTTRGQAFEGLYPALAAELHLPLVPDLYEDALGQPRFMQSDQVHPNAEGHLVLADNVLPELRALLAAR